VGKTILEKDQYDTTPTPAETLEHARDLLKALHISIQLRKQSEGMAPTNSGIMPDPITNEQAAFIWNQIPLSIRSGKSPDKVTTSEQLVKALNGLLTCNHPAEAQAALEIEEPRTWDQLLNAMTAHAHHECPEPEPETTIGGSRLFKVSDVPELISSRNYNGYRQQLVDFFASEEPPRRSEYLRALTRITSAFKDPHAVEAKAGWVMTNLVAPSWEQTCANFLSAMDDKFESQTILQDAKVAWLSVRPKPDERPTEFFTRFEAASTNYRSVATRKGIPAVSDPVLVERLLIVLPRYLTDAARNELYIHGKLMENMDSKELRKYFENKWTYLPRPAAHGHNTKTKYDTATTRAVPQTKEQNQVVQRQCGSIVSYDSAPPVPQQARGSLFPDRNNPTNDADNLRRRQYCAQHHLCKFCRRPINQHNQQSNFQAVTLANPNVRRGPANAESPTNDQGQLLLEAPTPTPA
jgi:hypothetical protein